MEMIRTHQVRGQQASAKNSKRTARRRVARVRDGVMAGLVVMADADAEAVDMQRLQNVRAGEGGPKIAIGPP